MFCGALNSPLEDVARGGGRVILPPPWMARLSSAPFSFGNQEHVNGWIMTAWDARSVGALPSLERPLIDLAFPPLFRCFAANPPDTVRFRPVSKFLL